MAWFKKKSIKKFDPADLKYDNLSELDNKAAFIYENSKEFLKKTAEITERIQKKVVLILGFCFSIMSLSASKIISIFSSEDGSNLALLNAKLVIFLLAVIIEYAVITSFFYWIAFNPKGWAVDGNEPKNLLTQGKLSKSFAFMQLGGAISYQSRIEINSMLNKRIATTTRFSVLLIILSPILSVLAIFYCFPA